MTELSVIIPTCNRQHILQQTFKQLRQAIAGLDAEIIVINDSNSDLAVDENIQLFRNPQKGAASARNFGAQQAKGQFLLFLDDDMLVSKEVIDQVLAETRAKTKTIFLPNWKYPAELQYRLTKTKFGRFLNRIGYTSLQGWIGQNAEWKDAEFISHSGMASYFLMIRKSDFEEVGRYNDRFLYAGFEDHDLTERLKEAGFQFFILPKQVIYHNERDRTGLKGWLARKRRNALTQRIGFSLGYTDLQISASRIRKTSYKLLYNFRFFFLFSAFCVPNFRLFDPVYVKHVELLTGLYMFRGYTYDYKKIEHKDQAI